MKICISDSEWIVMKVFWESPMLTISEVRKELEYTGWSDSTVKTLIRRLVQKGMLQIDNSHEQFIYYPTVEKSLCQKLKLVEFINRIFDGSIDDMIKTLFSEKAFTDEDKTKLLDLLDRLPS